MSSKVLRWLIFGVLFSLVPLGLDFLMALSRSQVAAVPTLTDVIGRGELCLIAVTLSVVGAGEISGGNSSGERTSIILMGASFLNAVFGVGLYVIMKSAPHTIQSYVWGSTILFASTVVVATSCISASEKADA
jgi:hypothetical protein